LRKNCDIGCSVFKSLKNKNVFLTGASGGIGKELAFEFASAGCNLFLTGRDRDKLESLTGEILKLNPDVSVTYQSGDLESLREVEYLIQSSRMLLGRIDILVNCAGSFIVKPLSKTSLEDYEKCFNINVRAPFLFSKHFADDMTEEGWGRIINIGSSSSYSGFKETSLYCSSKHALLGMSRSICDELKEKNVKTFCFSPGSVKTEMGKKVKNQDFSTFIDPKELAEYIVYTISFDSNMITEELRINRFKVK
jgi:short-subunit dehydrogenase